MTIEELQDICRSFKGMTEDIKWDTHLCFNVGGKVFLITAPDETPITASFKVSEEEFDSLSVKPGFMPAPYLAKYKWVKLDDIGRLGRKEWKRYLEEAYAIVAQKLTKKQKKEIGIE